MASSNIARLGVVLGLDMAEFSANIDKAISENRKLKNEIQRHTNAAVKELNELTEATADYGREVTKVEQIQRQIASGKFASATDDMKQRLLAQAAAYDAKVAAEKKSFDGTKLTMQQQQQLAYQTTDLVTQIASGQNALIALLQQGGQLKDSMGGFSNMFKVLAAQITPFRIAMFGAAAAIGSVTLAMIQGYLESDKLNKQLILTNNYAQLNQKSFIDLAATISDKTNVTIGKTRDILMSLVSSGKVSGDAMQSVAQAMALVSKFTGETAEEVSERLLPALNGGASGVKGLNDVMKFLTIEQYRQIEALEKAGNKQDAMRIAADALTARLEMQKQSLSPLEKAWQKVKDAASNAWNAMMGIGRMESTQERLDRTVKALNNAYKELNDAPGYQKGQKAGRVASLEQLKLELERQIAEEKKAAEKGAEEAKKIDLYAKAGGLQKELALNDEYLKLRTQNRYENAMFEAGMTQKIYLEAEQKTALARQEMARKNRDENNVFEKQNAAILAQQLIEIERDKQSKLREISMRELLFAEELRQQNRQDETDEIVRKDELYKSMVRNNQATVEGLQEDQRKLELQEKLIGLSSKEVALETIRLKYEEQRRRLRLNQDLSPAKKEGLERQIDQAEQIERNNALIQDSIIRIGQVHDAVFGNMMNAIERFVRTGKMSFRDMARSIIQDLLMIQIRAQATALFSMLIGNFGAAFTYGTNIGSQQTSMLAAQDAWFKGPRAAGGPVNSDGAYLVGERGPELFVPRSAGTIVPNHAMGVGGTTNVTNYNIQAIDVKSFEDRLMGSSNAIWAANLYAQKRLPLGAGRM